MQREAFLDRVRQAALAGQAHRVHSRDIPREAGYVGVAQDKCAALAREIDAVGGLASLVDGMEAARTVITGLLSDYRARSALCWQHRLLEQLRLDELLQQANITKQDFNSLSVLSHDDQRSAMLAADVGISSVDLAVAETGTLVVCSRPGQERVVSLVPPVHIAIVSESQVVPDLIDVFEHLGQYAFDNLPSNVALITGPSKTGDIELQLTTGVHGPGKWHVVIMRGV